MNPLVPATLLVANSNDRSHRLYITKQAVLEPFTFITSNPGKEIRGAMIEAFNEWLTVPEDKLAVIARVVNMLHNASLMYVTCRCLCWL
jgi:geranylgeranyl diphosphate synthase type 3